MYYFSLQMVYLSVYWFIKELKFLVMFSNLHLRSANKPCSEFCSHVSFMCLEFSLSPARIGSAKVVFWFMVVKSLALKDLMCY